MLAEAAEPDLEPVAGPDLLDRGKAVRQPPPAATDRVTVGQDGWRPERAWPLAGVADEHLHVGPGHRNVHLDGGSPVAVGVGDHLADGELEVARIVATRGQQGGTDLGPDLRGHRGTRS